jgi:predicted AAA+ superfamily ATPase
MYSRFFSPDSQSSYFLFGPRGTGKSSWLKTYYKKSNYIDLLDDEIFNNLTAQPKNVINYITDSKNPVIIDEVQKIPHLLDEVHRLIELYKYQFILTGSSARKLRKSGVNLLAGRALTYYFHPLISVEMKNKFKFKEALEFGLLPMATQATHPHRYLQSYIATYLKEEVQQERLTRNMPAFHRFIQAASLSQAAPLNISNVAAECSVERKVVEDYFSILRDLLITVELPVFSKKAKRELLKKSKFFYFDVGVFRAIRPRGPLDLESEIIGPALETLILQNIRAINDYAELGYELFYWHTRKHEEVDFILYGKNRLIAIEVKSSSRLREGDFDGLIQFKVDYPMAESILIYGGTEEKVMRGVKIVPAPLFLKNILKFLES